MNNINQVIIEGNVASELEVRTDEIGRLYPIFTLASTRVVKGSDGKNKEQTTYAEIDGSGITITDKDTKFFEKGKKMRVIGRLESHIWISDTGKKKSKLYIKAEYIDFGKQ